MTDAGEITLGQAISDKRFLEEGILDTIYKKIASGEGGKLGRAEVLAKALRDALEMRIQGTLAREGGDIAVKRYNQQNLETQTINRLAKLVAQSPTQPFSRDSAYMTLGGLAGATEGQWSASLVLRFHRWDWLRLAVLPCLRKRHLLLRGNYIEVRGIFLSVKRVCELRIWPLIRQMLMGYLEMSREMYREGVVVSKTLYLLVLC